MATLRALARIFAFVVCAVSVTCRLDFTARFANNSQGSAKTKLRQLLAAVFLTVTLFSAVLRVQAGSTFAEYEGRLITAVEITFEGSPADPAAVAEFLSIIKVLPNTQFSAVAIRDSLQALFDSERVANARVEVLESGSSPTGSARGPLRLRFVIQRQVQIGDVRLTDSRYRHTDF